jgi:hypothetical protein
VELNGQTNKLQRAINRNKDTQNEIGQSEGLVDTMSRRSFIVRTITYLMVVFIVVGLVVIIWYNFFHK